MANKKISDFTAATSAAFGDLLEIETVGGNSRKITKSNLLASVGSEFIEEIVTSGSQSSATFSSLGSFRHLELWINGPGVAANPLLRFNGDTGANYKYAYFNHSSAAGSGASGSGSATSFLIGGGGSDTHTTIVRIPDYRGSTKKNFTGEHTNYDSGGINHAVTGGGWNNTAALTSLTYLMSSGNIPNGTILSLYGRK